MHQRRLSAPHLSLVHDRFPLRERRPHSVFGIGVTLLLSACGGGGSDGAGGSAGAAGTSVAGTGGSSAGAGGSASGSAGAGGAMCPPGQVLCTSGCAATCGGSGGGAGTGGSSASGGAGAVSGAASGGTGNGGTTGCSDETTYEAESIDSTTGAELDEGWNLWANGAVFTNHDFEAGAATITVRAQGMVAQDTWPHLRVSVGGNEIGEATVEGTAYSDYTFPFTATAGTQEIRVEFDNDFSDDVEDRNLIVDRIVVSGCGMGGSGGAGGTGGTGGGAGTAGSAGSAGSAGAPPVGEVFDECRFHFGTIDSMARDNAALRAQIDYFTPGWMGQSDSFDMGYVCDQAGAGAPFDGIVPAIVAYVIAFNARRDEGLEDCNVSGNTNLCRYGATYMRNHLEDRIIPNYRTYAQGFADCYGTTKPIIFMMEPDYYQYHVGGDANALSPEEAGQIMGRFVSTMREHLPNAVFSLDISPWIPDQGRDWYSNFDLAPFTFINTSGGGTDADTDRIRSANDMTWAGVSGVTGKPILADTGYGVAGAPTGHDSIWDSISNINARIADGVVGVAQYNPSSNWGSTIAQIRPELDTPSRCP
jgi:hypothetical protein